MGYNRCLNKMKKTFLTLVLALAFMPVFSQATLRHVFTNDSGGLHSVFQNSIHEYVYEILPEVSYVVCELDEDEAITGFSVYDADFQLTKEIPFTVEGKWGIRYSSFGVVIAGKHLFNDDDKIEICLTPWKQGGRMCTMILNEDGEVLFMQEGSLISYLYRAGDELRFEISNAYDNYNIEVYATNGNFSADEMVVSTQSPFPNPASTLVSVPYTLDGKAAEMHIYDSRGVLVDKKTLDPDAEWIDLNVSAYRPGIYIYEYNGVSTKFVVR